MSELYVSVADDTRVPIASLITFFTVKYVAADVRLILVKQTPLPEEPLYAVDLSGLRFTRQENAALAQCCQLPAIVLPDGCTVVSGLCAVLRQMAPTLLGFRRSCLVATAQVSTWTRFCEVELPSLDLLQVARFETHLAQPSRVHNQPKDTAHVFSEGADMTLSDVVLFPCFYIISQSLDLKRLPLTCAWFNRMTAQPGITQAARIIRAIPDRQCSEIPRVPEESLYKSDGKRYKPAFTRQEDIDSALCRFSASGLAAPWLERTFGWEMSVDWSSLPHPEVPASRLERKRSQLESMARAVLSIAQPGQVIADFCSGSGHLGLLLAVLLPECRLLLLENKAESQDRARARGTRLGLANVTYIQSNLDYFTGRFDVGVALHACGVATDLVLQRCIDTRAAFVVCPCCYGNIDHPPRSRKLAACMDLRDYIVLAHSADQTHEQGHEKTAQGNVCMAAIDADRLQAAVEAGYQVSISKLHPTTCSPKNNLLVGQPSNQTSST